MAKEKKVVDEQYLGPFKVVGIVKMDVKTPLGGDVIEVLYENRPKEIVPLKAFELLVSPVPVDLTTLQRRRFDYLIPKLIEQIAEVDVRMSERVSLFGRLNETIEDHFERASNYLWTGDDRNWAKGVNFMNNRTLIETHKTLLEMNADPKSHENDGITGNTSDDSGQDS